ncbi:MAG: hypothetical protein LBT51_09215 [Fusobacteriaceae bacterium]|jgi:uncharacterized membrane protein YkvI|nr:hypothetical protein [Fusobacteriaceae bacterium]
MTGNEKSSAKKMAAIGAFAVASVMFSSHAGGGFATGNQANQYYVSTGIVGIVSVVLAMALLGLTIREAIIMKTTRNLKTHKEVFEVLYHPFGWLEILFEVYFNIMLICAAGAVVAGASKLVTETIGLSNMVTVVLIGIVLLVFSIFGVQLVAKASTVMAVGILITLFIIYFAGIGAKLNEIKIIISNPITSLDIKKGFINAFVYAGFQCVFVPTMIACGRPLETKKKITCAMVIAFVMNTLTLCLSVLMLLGWKVDFTAAGQTTLPVLYICKQLDIKVLNALYQIALLLCLISSGVNLVYGFITRFSSLKIVEKIEKPINRRIVTGAVAIIFSSILSLAGLDRIVKFGYGYCGYLGIFIIVIPFLTIGYYRNRKYIKENMTGNDNINTVDLNFSGYPADI